LPRHLYSVKLRRYDDGTVVAVLIAFGLSVSAAPSATAPPPPAARPFSLTRVSAPDPRPVVRTFLLRPSPARACAQLSPRYRAELAARYGPCVDAIKANPTVTRIRFSNLHLSRTRAVLDVRYLAGGRPVAERMTLVVIRGAWRIDGARPL